MSFCLPARRIPAGRPTFWITEHGPSSRIADETEKESPFSAVLLIAFAAVGLHVLLIFLFKPIQTDSHALRTGSHYTVICKPEDLAGKDIHQLNYWLKYMEPETFVKPNDEHGFSMVREMRYYDFLQPVKAAPELFRRASGTYGADRRSVSVRELADLNSSPQIPVAVPHVKKAETVPLNIRSGRI